VKDTYYGTMVTYAETLGMKEAVRLLKQTLAEETQRDEKLTTLPSTINFEAEEQDGEA
jgi:ferritin-like metal-binding protein YciE